MNKGTGLTYSLAATAAAAVFSSSQAATANPSALLDASAAATTASLTYDSWCHSWGLACPPAEAADPGLTAAQWKSVLRVGNAVMQGQTTIDLNAAALSDESLKQIATNLGYGDT